VLRVRRGGRARCEQKRPASRAGRRGSDRCVARATDELRAGVHAAGMKKVLAIVLGPLFVSGAALALPPAPPTATPDPDRPWLIPPVDAPIGERFEAPEGPFGAGHRGIDYAVGSRVAVRAAADGRVSFAGFVPGGDAVTIEHTGGMETTYSLLSDVHVREGAFVSQGHFIGSTGHAHGGSDGGLHFGVRVEGAYVDPERYLGPLDVTGAIRLTPLSGSGEERRDALFNRLPEEVPAEFLRDLEVACTPTEELPAVPAAPTENVAVVIGGIASKTQEGASYEAFRVPELLGYPPDRTYVFSYRGVDGPHHHEPYERTDTYASMSESAGRLTALLLRIAEDHPGSGVDLIAHSQGGIVARTFLQRAARAWQAGLPTVEHLVTFATPHHGTEAAALGDRLRNGTYSGLGLSEGAEWLSDRGLPIPAPDSPALRDLSVDSNLIDDLARSDVLYGTRVLSLGSPYDLAVPAHRALYQGDRTAIVDGNSWFRSHSTILSAPGALALAHNFLRDGERACGEGTSPPPISARAIDFVQRWAPTALRILERRMIVGRALGR
jgi:hypothetical protein